MEAGFAPWVAVPQRRLAGRPLDPRDYHPALGGPHAKPPIVVTGVSEQGRVEIMISERGRPTKPRRNQIETRDRGRRPGDPHPPAAVPEFFVR